jgi:hypothetical protein
MSFPTGYFTASSGNDERGAQMNILAVARGRAFRGRAFLLPWIALAVGVASPVAASEAEGGGKTEAAAREQTAPGDTAPDDVPVAGADIVTKTPATKRSDRKRTDKKALRRDLMIKSHHDKSHDDKTGGAPRLSEEARAALHRDLRTAIRSANDTVEIPPPAPSVDKAQPVEYRQDEAPGP